MRIVCPAGDWGWKGQGRVGVQDSEFDGQVGDDEEGEAGDGGQDGFFGRIEWLDTES